MRVPQDPGVPTPPAPAKPKPPPVSWHQPSPCLFTASDPDAARGRAGVGSTLQIMDTGDGRPDWITPDSSGIVYQAEGQAQAILALERIRGELSRPGLSSRAVVTTLGIDPAPFVALGVTSCMVECYAQAGAEPYGDLAHMAWQAHHDGWPHVIPTLGVYDAIGLQWYLDHNGGPANFRHGHWRGGPLAIYLAEGMTDTGSWPILAVL